MELERIRREIDAIDDELTKLFIKRMNLSDHAAKYKKENNLPVLNAEREQEILSRAAQKAGPELSSYSEDFFNGLLAVSRLYQRGRMNKFGLAGADLSYSYSKTIHEMFGDYNYELFSLNAEEFETLMNSRDFDGLNITVPYKRAVIPFCDELDDTAAEIGAVNTVYKKNGRLIGANTDHYGFLYTLDVSGISLNGKKVLILGAGGVSLAIQKCARDKGASEITVAGRNHDYSSEKDAEIIINATPVGSGLIIDPADFPDCSGVIDVVYNPLHTDLLLRAKELGMAYSNGIPMLVAQAAAAGYLFTGVNYSHKIGEVTDKLTAAVQNIVLIGMPGAGKTVLGRKLAHILDKDFVDLDEAVSAEAGMSVGDIFEKFGEEHFRDMETAAAAEFGKRRGIVIATGGGCVLRRENMDALCRNGVVIYLDKPLELLDTKGRPLSRDVETLKKMYNERRPLYERYGDHLWRDQCMKRQK